MLGVQPPKEKAVRGDRPGVLVRRKSFTGFVEGLTKSSKVFQSVAVSELYLSI